MSCYLTLFHFPFSALQCMFYTVCLSVYDFAQFRTSSFLRRESHGFIFASFGRIFDFEKRLFPVFLFYVTSGILAMNKCVFFLVLLSDPEGSRELFLFSFSKQILPIWVRKVTVSVFVRNSTSKKNSTFWGRCAPWNQREPYAVILILLFFFIESDSAVRHSLLLAL